MRKPEVVKTYDRAALMAALGVTCKGLRRRAGIAQEDLAYAAGLERAHVSKIERGLGNPNLVTIYKLLPHLKIDFAGFATEFDAALRKRRRI